ncbi:MAG: Gfo/Idh/MocA family oxidoreductase, partial [Anaerolineae bacterium]|nr:Gfo/Idh/MocA family oxidoreductase [Anaerolineae bacterium]
IGVVGAAGRGRSFAAPFDAHPATQIHAVCDIQAEALPEAARQLGAAEMYTNYEEMIDKAGLDAVVIGTPMHLHAEQTIMALERDIHVLCEVTVGVSIEECRAVLEATKRSDAVYMMAENYTYIKSNVLVRELVRRGLFGEVYYAEGEYLHELKELNEITKWRRIWQTGIDGITYPSHSLGPILQWMDDRVVRVACEGSGHHYTDPRGDLYENQDSCVMLAKTANDGLIKIRVDMLSDRPHAMSNYSLQGTTGCYESARSRLEPHKIWLADLAPDANTWMELQELEAAYLPEMWRNPPEAALKAGHGGGDYFEVLDFVNSIINGTPCPIGIHEALDMTLPGLVSQASVLDGGSWLDVPDSRTW